MSYPQKVKATCEELKVLPSLRKSTYLLLVFVCLFFFSIIRGEKLPFTTESCYTLNTCTSTICDSLAHRQESGRITQESATIEELEKLGGILRDAMEDCKSDALTTITDLVSYSFRKQHFSDCLESNI